MKAIVVSALLGAFLVGVSEMSIARAAVAPAAPASETSAFAGSWKVTDAKERVFFIDLKADGTAASRWQDAAETRRNQTGTWKLVDGAAVINWDNGWRETISAAGAGFVKKAYAPKLTLEGEPSNQTPAEKVDAAP